MMNYVYILACKDGSYYTGWTNNLEKRVEKHNQGTASKYTRARLPVKVVYFESFETKEAAMKREYEIKQMSRKEKVNLVKIDT
ncbi:GIY-YIG nuclease family protein [Serpentinicella sp. ANB-PHB4]|uniref:GIY-YIG nuclease family protein n=1 Tax=Serpentinicella sp. ANB-PHB4 TaxID=3074076 RepID=UPI002F417A40